MLPVTPRIRSLSFRLMVSAVLPRPRTLVSVFKFFSCGGPEMAPALPLAADSRGSWFLVLELWGVFFLYPVADAGFGDLFERGAGGLLVPGVDLGLGAPVELAGALGGEHHQHVTIGHVVEGLFEGWERHHAGTSMSGKRRVNRLVRQRSAWMMVASWSTASFTSRLMIR